jgi:flavin-dependent dehydrogenase
MNSQSQNLQNTYDIVVTGGGSAGLAAAITAQQQGLKVIVFDAAGADYDKPCGEGLMPEGVHCLKKLGIALPQSQRICGISYKFSDGTSVNSYFESHRVAIGMRRKFLRSALWQRAKDLGIEMVQKPIHSFRESKEFIEVGGIQAKNWIIAEGLKSKNARQLGLIKNISKNSARFAVRRHVAVKPWSSFVEVYWHDHCEAYITPVSDDCINIAFISFKAESFDSLLEHFPVIRSRIFGATFTSEVAGAGPMHQRSVRRKQGRIFLVGDTAGFVDPMTGEGNSLALKSGIACAELIAKNQGFLYPIKWYAIIWRYWVLTSLSLWGIKKPNRKNLILSQIKRWPTLMQWGLDFLTHSRQLFASNTQKNMPSINKETDVPC